MLCLVTILIAVSFSSAQDVKSNQSEAKVFITATMHAKPGMRDELRKKLLERAQHGRSEAGCIRFDVLTQSDDPDTFLLNEAWVSDESLGRALQLAGRSRKICCHQAIGKMAHSLGEQVS